MMFRSLLTLSLAALALHAHGQTTLYGLDIPQEITEQVEAEKKRLNRDTSLYITRGVEFRDQKDALRQFEKDEAERKYRHEKFPQFPPELVIEERMTNFKYDEARKRSLFDIKSQIQDIRVDPSTPQTYVLEASVGEPTRLVFFDQSGTAWPVLRADSGKVNRFRATVEQEIPEQNQVSIELDDNFVEGNVLVNLQDYGVPLVFRIVANPTKTTPYANVRIHRYGPNTQLSYSKPGPMDLDGCRDVYGLLENIDVPGASRNYLNGLTGQVFVTKKHTYVRSPYRLVFPPNSCSISDGNGNYAARIDSTGHHTATFVLEDGEYETVGILDTRPGA